jgi:hypothetical protein
MKNIFFAFLGILLFSNGAFAQLKAVKYTDGNQKLNGLSIAP